MARSRLLCLLLGLLLPLLVLTAAPSLASHVPAIQARSLGVAASEKDPDGPSQDAIEVQNVAPDADRLVFVWVVHRADVAVGVQQIDSIEGLGLTWTKEFHSTESNLTRFALFSAVTGGTAPSPGTIRIEFDSESQRTNVIVLEAAGIDLTAGSASAYTNLVVHEGFSNTTSRTHYLESFIDPGHNATLAFHLVGDGQNISVEAGMTRTAFATNNVNMASAAAFEPGEEVTPTFSWSKEASNGGLALELRAPGTPPERQITRRHLTQGTVGLATNTTTAAIDPAPGRLLIAFVANMRSSGPDVPSLAGPGETGWSVVGTKRFDTADAGQKRVTALVAESGSEPPAAIAISFPRAQERTAWIVFELADAELSEGADAAVRQAHSSAVDAATEPNTSLIGFGSPENATVAAVGFETADTAAPDDGFAPEPGFALAMGTDTHIPVGTGDLRLWSEWRASPETTPSGALEVPSNAAMVALEIKAAGVTQLPYVRSVTPARGPDTGGTEVVITGSDLTDDQPSGVTTPTVRFGTVDAASVQVDSPSQIRATAPEQAPGVVSVRVANGVGTSEDTPADDYTYLPLIEVMNASAGEETGAAIFAVNLSATAPFPVSVDLATRDDTAKAPGDYQATNGTITIQAGQQSGEFAVPLVDDALDEDTEDFIVDLSNPTNAIVSDARARGRIVDDDPPPSLSVNDVTATEGASSAVFTVSLSAVSGRGVQVEYATADGTAASGSDYESTTGTLTIPAGASSGQVAVPLLNDSIHEGTESFNLDLSSPLRATIADGQGVATISDDEGPPNLSVNDVTLTEGDSGSKDAVFTVSISHRSASAVSASYATSDGTATAGQDYASGTGTVEIPAGQTSAEIRVQVTGDTADEPDETFFVDLSNPSGAVIADGRGVGTITDDDPHELRISDVTVTEGNSGSVDAWFTVSLSTPSSSGVSASFATANGTATAGQDYTAKSGTVSLAAGETSKQFRVQVTGDTADEPDETFFVDLSNPSGAVIADGRGVGTITDDDPPALSISDVAVTEGNSGTTDAWFTLSLGRPSSSGVSVTFATSDGSASAGSDYVAKTGSLSIPAGETSKQFRVQVLGDTVDEPDEDFFVDLSNPSGATIADGRGVGTITDDDDAHPPPTPALSIGDASILEGAPGQKTTMHLPVTLSAPASTDVTFSYATRDGTATASTGDYIAKSGVAIIPSGSTSTTVRVVVRGDSLDELDESFFVDISNPQGASIYEEDRTGEGTIRDDDP